MKKCEACGHAHNHRGCTDCDCPHCRYVVRVGDAADPRRVTDAMAEGALAILHAKRNL